MDDLTAWLRQQLDDDEQAADDWHTNSCPVVGPDRKADPPPLCGCPLPRRALAEVDAKRRIVDSFAASTEPLTARTAEKAVVRMVLKLLALPYADRPGYRDEWKP